jgi:hypothetical protein
VDDVVGQDLGSTNARIAAFVFVEASEAAHQDVGEHEKRADPE